MIESVTNIDSILTQEVYCTHKARGCRKTLLLSELEVRKSINQLIMCVCVCVIENDTNFFHQLEPS